MAEDVEVGGVMMSGSPVYGFAPVTPRKSPLERSVRRSWRWARFAR
jgi:hypothetical protein